MEVLPQNQWSRYSCYDVDWKTSRKTSKNFPRLDVRVVTWYMGSGLKAQNMTGIRTQRKGLRAQKNEIRDHRAFEPESGIRFITRSKNLLSHRISWPRYITYSYFRLAAVPVIRSPGCLTKTWYHILNLFYC